MKKRPAAVCFGLHCGGNPAEPIGLTDREKMLPRADSPSHPQTSAAAAWPAVDGILGDVRIARIQTGQGQFITQEFGLFDHDGRFSLYRKGCQYA